MPFKVKIYSIAELAANTPPVWNHRPENDIIIVYVATSEIPLASDYSEESYFTAIENDIG